MSADIEISAHPHPLRHAPVTALAPEGLSLADIIGEAHDHTHISLDGEYIPRERWSLIYPRAGSLVTVRALPAGGDDTWRAIATIALVVVSFYVPGAYGLKGWQAYAASAAITMAGNLAINALIPPHLPQLGDMASFNGGTRRGSLTGVRNQMIPYGTVPRPYGRMKVYPAILGKPVTEIIGNDQYLRTLFCVGIGKFQLSDLRIGDTSVLNYQDVQINVGAVTVDSTYGGRVTTGNPLDLYSRDVNEQPLTDVLTSSAGGNAITRTTAAGTTEIGLDVVMPTGLHRIDNQNNSYATGVILAIEYAPMGTSTWSNVANITNLKLSSENVRLISTPSGNRFMVYGKTNDTLRAGISWPVAAGQYDVRITPDNAYNSVNNDVKTTAWGGTVMAEALPNPVFVGLTYTLAHGNISNVVVRDSSATPKVLTAGVNYQIADAQAGRIQILDLTTGGPFTQPLKVDYAWSNFYALGWPKGAGDALKAIDITWSALRSWQPGQPVSQDLIANSVLIGMRIRATDQLSGMVDQFSLIAQAVLPVWNGTTWGDQVTRNPAWAYVDALTGVQNALALAKTRTNTTTIKAWADWCDLNGFYYDSRGDQERTVFDLIREITAAGRATWAIRDGLYTVVRDLSGLVPVQMFTPRNSSGFRATKTFPDRPHALKVRFVNPNAGWIEDEAIVYDDGYSATGAGGTTVATKFEAMNLPGVADYNQAWKLGRYHLAALKLRPETYQINADIENLACVRGDVVRVAHDVTLWGSGWGRIKSVTTDVNGNVTGFVSDETLTMDGVSSYVVRVRKQDGAQVVIGVTTITGETIAIVLTTATAGINAGDLFILGIVNQESVDLKVTRVDPGPDLSALLTLVDDASGIQTADSGAIPPFQTYITQPLDINNIKPPAPTITKILSNETVLVRDIDGSLRIRMVVWFGFSVQVGLPRLQIEMRYRETNGQNPWHYVGPISATAGWIDTQQVVQLQTYEVQLRAINGAMYSDWSASVNETIVGKSSKPADVTGFHYSLQTDGVLLGWNAVADLDLADYEARSDTNFGVGTPLDRTVALESLIPAQKLSVGNNTLYIKARDTSNNYSINAASLVVAISGPPPVSPLPTEFAGENVLLKWSAVAGSFPVTECEIREGATWGTGVLVAKTKSTSLPIKASWGGDKTFWIVAYDIAMNASTPVSFIVTISPPSSPTQFLVSRDPDGTRRFTWGASAPAQLPIAGYQMRYGLGLGQVWANMTALHQGTLTASPYETNQLAAGTYTFAIVTVDLIGNASTPVYIEAALLDPRLAGALEIVTPHLAGWPGVKTNCVVDAGTGWLVATDTKTWADFPTQGKTWGNWTQWSQAANTLIYTDNIIDVGLVTKFTPLVSAEYIGTATLEVRTSNDNITWSAWAAPAGQVNARYFQARATIAPVNGQAMLKTMTTILDAAPIVEDINDLNTALLTGAYRIGVGDVRLPITKTYGAIRAVSLALQNIGPGWSWEIIDKSTSPGPRIKIYNAANALADCIIDATVRGI